MFGFVVNAEQLPWFQIALTNSSAHLPINYERLEFIGDIVVKLAVSVALFFAFPDATEGGLSVCASDYKSNMRLGAAAVRMGFGNGAAHSVDLNDQFEIDLQTRQEAIPKCHGDIFEAVTASVTMIHGIVPAIRFVQENLLGPRFDNRANEAQLDPKSL
jgi:ribonuclease-3